MVNPSACSKKTSAWPARAARAAAVHRASGPSPGGPLDFHWDHRFLSLWDVHLDFHWIFTGFFYSKLVNHHSQILASWPVIERESVKEVSCADTVIGAATLGKP